MIKNLFKKLLIAATAVLSAGAICMASACNVESDHPEIKITVEFNSSTYELEYTLYRNMYPNTVRHFIELSQNGFYDNMIVHDYTSGANDWFTGGYYYDGAAYAGATEAGEGAMNEYLETHSAETSYLNLFHAGKLTPSVYKYHPTAVSAENALPTLIGEFRENIKQEIEKGALTASFGSLKMFYFDKTTNEKVSVTPTPEQVIMADYKSNCATSFFMIQVGATSSFTENRYCVFGRINDSSKLTELIDAVKDHLKTFTDETVAANNVTVENDPEIFSPGDRTVEQNFTLPYVPIIIKSVSVTKF